MNDIPSVDDIDTFYELKSFSNTFVYTQKKTLPNKTFTMDFSQYRHKDIIFNKLLEKGFNC